MDTVISDYNVYWGVKDYQAVSIFDSILSLANWRDVHGNDLHTKFADPMFTSIENEDFIPLEGSPAIDAGVGMNTIKARVGELEGMEWILKQLDSMEEVDLGGHNRSACEAPDIGALEFGGVPSTLTGDVDTGDWMGWINVDYAPFLYSYSLQGWIYMDDFPTDGPGAWGYFYM